MIILNADEKLSMEQLLSLVGKISAIIYVRVSTTDQAEKGYSLESQIERCVERAMSKFGFTKDEIIVLIEAGGMGDDPNRPSLNYALYLLEKGLGKKFIVLHPDRLSRDNTLQGVVSRKIWNLGVDIEFVEFEVDPTNPESMLMYNIQGSIAQYNKAKILANSKRGRTQKAKKGEIPSFKRLYGYTYNKETDTLDVNEEEREVILDMVKMLLEDNISCNQIAIDLSKRGVKAPSGDVWYQNTVSRILRNEDYKGIYYYGKTQTIQKEGTKKQVPRPKEEWIPINIPRILDDVTFEKIQIKIDEFTKGKGRKSKTYLLKGIAKCGRCGSAAGSGITSKVKDGVYRYYACRKKASKGYEVGTGLNTNKCVGRNWRVDIVDEVVWKWLIKRIENPEEVIREITSELSDKNRIDKLKKQKQNIDKRIAELKKEESNYILLFGKQKITEEQFDELVDPIKAKVGILNDELSIVVNQLVTMENEFDELEMVKQNVEKFKTIIKNEDMSIEEKRAIVALFIKKVYLHEDNTIEIIAMWGNSDENSHKKQTLVQDDSVIFYVTSKHALPEPQWMNGEHVYSYEKYKSELDKLCDLHFNQLVPFNKLEKETGVPAWIIKGLFEAMGIEKLSFKEIAKRRREKDFELLYDLHFNKRMSLNDIYREYGFSPIYVKTTFADKGLKHLGFINQLDVNKG